MNFSIFKIVQVFGIVASWLDKALADGKVTLNEAADLAISIAEILGVAIDIEVPTDADVMASDIAEPGKIGDIWNLETEEITRKPQED